VRWRQQALAWLRTDVALLTRQLDQGTRQARTQVQGLLEHWQQDPDLAGIRDEAGLAWLSDAERPACRQLWADVAASLRRARSW
jgi:hypothetical protein